MQAARLQPIHIPLGNGVVEGHCALGWEPLLVAFLANFRERQEVGASLCVKVHGETLIDVWGGFTDPARSVPWREETITVVFSCTKGATALCAHLLAERGQLDLLAPAAEYWPEFAQSGKEGTTVAMLLDHSAGVPGFREDLKPQAFMDWDYMVQRLEQEEAFWQPGSQHGYHLLSFGWTVGEVVRRVSGQSLGAFFQRELALPAGVDFWIGLPPEQEARVAQLISCPAEDNLITDLHHYVFAHRDAPISRAIMNDGGFDAGETDPETGRCLADTPAAHAAQVGAAGGITNGRGLAGLYAHALHGPFSADALARMGRVSSASRRDAVLQIPTRFGLGFMVSMDNRDRPLGHIESVILGERAFGHVGAGGSLGFADPECGLAFGYTMNRMGPGLLLDQRGQSLVDATYRLLGYRSCASGAWRR